uniref:Uncharacterized protein n=1 Tax=Trieres chinensis TaxID=1514140 RepID=A0A7S2EUZ8_TRICV|mmetsp:Transcript_4621/g.9753  ORF Transcript_4621/g.9753 Transcript_4621/m.9753 type:complete len:213 (+) Transcript_4621:208-846(+)
MQQNVNSNSSLYTPLSLASRSSPPPTEGLPSHLQPPAASLNQHQKDLHLKDLGTVGLFLRAAVASPLLTLSSRLRQGRPSFHSVFASCFLLSLGLSLLLPPKPPLLPLLYPFCLCLPYLRALMNIPASFHFLPTPGNKIFLCPLHKLLDQVVHQLLHVNREVHSGFHPNLLIYNLLLVSLLTLLVTSDLFGDKPASDTSSDFFSVASHISPK